MKNTIIGLVLAMTLSRAAVAGLVFADDFDPVDSTQWLLTSDAGARGAGLAGFDFGNALHFRGNGVRSGTTVPIDVSGAAGIVEFDFRGGNEDIDGSALWEDTDVGEDAVLEYSIDGTNFIVMSNLDLFQFRNDAPTTTWLSVTVPIPAAALTTSTQFRWRQLNHSGSNNWDHWAIDNVRISSTPEPAGFLLLSLTLGPVALRNRKRRASIV